MKISIVIPALNEAKNIKRGIKALQHQTIPREQYEIVVIDNLSKDGTPKIARQAGADIVVSQHLKGTNFARQKGVDVSSGKIVAFLDADCVPGPDWLEKIEANLRQPGVAGVSGPYDYGFTGLNAVGAWFFNVFLLPRLGSLVYFIFGRKMGVMIFGNSAAWRSAIKKIGGLPPLAFWGDDSATAALLSRRVGKVVFDPHLIIKSSPRRFDKEGLFKLQKKYAQAFFKVYFSKDYE